jgi:hypothetical protein
LTKIHCCKKKKHIRRKQFNIKKLKKEKCIILFEGEEEGKMQENVLNKKNEHARKCA